MAVNLHGHEVKPGLMTTLFPMMMHAHLMAHGVMMVIVRVRGRDGRKHRDGSHGSKDDFFHIAETQFVERSKARCLTFTSLNA